jgi:hypothetical protein
MPAAQLRAISADEPAPPDAARARLRDAIARVTAAQAAVATAEQARDRVHAGFLSALRSLDVAKDALRAAEADNQANRVAVLMGEAQTGPALSDLRRAVELAETVAAGARSDEQLLDAEIARRRQQLDFATIARDGAVSDVLRPTAAVLLQRIQESLTTAAGLRSALAVFPPDSLPAYWQAEQQHPENPALSAQWRTTIEALGADADAPIPETE